MHTVCKLPIFFSLCCALKFYFQPSLFCAFSAPHPTSPHHPPIVVCYYFVAHLCLPLLISHSTPYSKFSRPFALSIEHPSCYFASFVVLSATDTPGQFRFPLGFCFLAGLDSLSLSKRFKCSLLWSSQRSLLGPILARPISRRAECALVYNVTILFQRKKAKVGKAASIVSAQSVVPASLRTNLAPLSPLLELIRSLTGKRMRKEHSTNSHQLLHR